MIFNNYKSINETLNLYSIDRNLMPLMIHENSISYLNNNVDASYSDKLSTYSHILDNLSDADVIDKNIFGDQNWDLSELNGINKCTYPSYYINILKKKPVKDIELNYSNLLSKASQQFSYYKELLNLMNIFNCNITNIIYIVEFILFNIFNKDGNKDYAFDLMLYNKIDIDYIDNLLKVGKIDSSYRNEFTCRKKTSLKKLFDNRKSELMLLLNNNN